ncbi:S8 family serine peptidase [Paraclostridium sordellii]|uniref:S8 family serine peptidase n=1 Tax=Paraclostridium sordellii TaxID=1505 RepID=UPI0005E7CDA3|nr:S8 family serine peptidase [Paeniclostridium sordellii]CEN23879.1 serine protease [[Clostridium] sordellii] [Paeniclostridium sordellii]
MSKLKIAIIDTGVDIHDKEIKNFIRFDRNLQVDSFENEYINIDDVNGHGTLCAKTIISICNHVEIYPIKVFDNYGKTSSWKVVEVMKNLLNSDINIINISASTLNCPCVDEMSFICRELKKNGKIIICSHHNNKDAKFSIPTKFKEVIGVKGIDEIYNDIDYMYNPNNEIQMYSNSKDRLIKFKNNITHFGKNSRAAAIATGLVADIMKNDINMNFKELEQTLIKNSISDKNYMKNGKIEKLLYNQDELEIISKLINIININFANISVDFKLLKKYNLFNNLTNIGKHNAYYFLEKINENFSIDIDYGEVFLYELNSLDNIVGRIYSKLQTDY